MMRKVLCFAAAALLSIVFVNRANSQGLYVGIDAGYALKAASATTYNAKNDHTQESVNYSLGKGFDAGLMVGYMFNKNLGIELGASYLIGGKTETKSYTMSGTSDETKKGSMIRLVPSVVVAAGFDKIDPYAKFGAIIGFGSVTTEYTDIDEGAFKSTMSTEYKYKYKDKGGVALGLNAALGANYNLSDALAIFAELNFESLSYSPTKGELTEYTIDGADGLGDLTTSQKEFEYVDELDYTASQPDSDPTKMLKYKEPFSSIGLNIGLKIKL